MRSSRNKNIACLLALLILATCQVGGPAPVKGPEADWPAIFSNLPATRTPFLPLPPTLGASATPLPPATPASTPTPAVSPTSPPEITLLFTGVIVPARCVQAAIDARADADYVYDEVRDLIQQADLAVGTLNATISDYPPHTGCVFTYVLVGDARNADALQRAGFDVMSVATNHIKNCGMFDCGNRAFLDTLDNLNRVDILPVGGGNHLAEAMRPLVVTVKGVRFGIVSLGMIEPSTFASADTPGIAPLDDENLKAAIAAARKVSDVVIAMPHMGPEDDALPTGDQQHFARLAVKAGADLVVGNHTHVVQALQQINGVPVFYGLGNFVFDQTWALDHQQGVILQVKFEGTQYKGYTLIPTHVDGDGTVHVAGEQEAADVLQRVEEASSSLK